MEVYRVVQRSACRETVQVIEERALINTRRRLSGRVHTYSFVHEDEVSIIKP